MAALFGSSSQRQGGKKNLLEFKAGKMYLQGKMCHADKRKGLVFIHQTDDSLMHFCWKDRSTGKVEEASAVIIVMKAQPNLSADAYDIRTQHQLDNEP